MAKSTGSNYGTILKGMPIKSGPQKANTPKSTGKTSYPNGTSKKSK